jgi:CheY-like chemotaxis protein
VAAVLAEPAMTNIGIVFPQPGWHEAVRAACDRTGTILVIDDDAVVRRAVSNALDSLGYTPIEATSGADAVELYRARGSDIRAVVLDMVMPVMSGKALAQTLTQRRPNLAVLYMSGYTDEAIVKDGVLDAGVHLLPKPFTPERLLEAVGQALGARRGERRFSARSA